MTAPADTNAHTTISKLRSRFGGLGKGSLGKSHQSTTSTTVPKPSSSPHSGIDYSVNARNFVAKQSLTQLYPAIDPFKTGLLKVDDRHEVYWEACGNEKGAPGVYRRVRFPSLYLIEANIHPTSKSSFCMAVQVVVVHETTGLV
jgi:hypothetical protein